ncbi:MAG TPA: hypothetical protein VFW73_09645, partial [Lacipirellulaceae bacterium]|nr:hypothetical protein [Lacipirellulaceae bacterium]
MSEQKVRRHDRAAMKQSLERPIARHERKLPRQWAEEESLLTLAAVSLLAGTVPGLVGAAFRVLLEKAESLRDSLIVWAHAHHYWLGLVLV